MRRWATPVLALALIVVAGLAWGILWHQFAPTAATQIIDNQVYLSGHQELMAEQDGWFALLGAAAGALLSAVWPFVTRRTPVTGLVVGLVGSVAAGLLAWWLGSALGPASLHAQVRAGVKAPITPLVLHVPVALLFAPAAFAVVRLVIEVVGVAGSTLRGIRSGEVPSGPQAVDVQQGQ